MYGVRKQDWLPLREIETKRGHKEVFWGGNVPCIHFGTGYITVFTL